jgi:hypothetical protein
MACGEGSIMSAAKPLSQAHKDAISRGQIARHQKARSQEVERPDKKRCTACNEWKRVPDDYTMRKRTLASGEVRKYPAGECKKCSAERAAKWRDNLRAKGELKERQQEYNLRRDPEHKREYNREYSAMRRRAEGVKSRGPWKKYRDQGRTALPVEPLAVFLEELVYRHGMGAVALAAGVDQRRLFSIVEKEYSTITLEVADRILTGLNYPEQLVILYPEMEE